VAPVRTDLHAVRVAAAARFAEPVFTILLVCTGNICRSALAERLGRAYLDEVLGVDADAIRLISAGTQAVVGSAMHPDSAVVLAGFGATPGDFRARQLPDTGPAEADLVLAMTRSHRREVLRLAPRTLARSFTLREAADVVGRLDDDLELPGDDFGQRARALVAAMATARSRRVADEDRDDVPDPINRPIEAHEEVGELIAAALLPVLRRITDLRNSGTAVARASSGAVEA
jgi:protein-tyrosine-phosphatase